eukprot:4997985-Prorocentrum_lima.AAC.1
MGPAGAASGVPATNAQASLAEMSRLRKLLLEYKGNPAMQAALTAELQKVTEAYHGQRPLAEQIAAIQHTRKA